MELNFDAAVLVREDLLPRGADHDRRLRPLHDRLSGGSLRTERQGNRDTGETVVINKFGAAGAIAAHLSGMLDVGENIVAVGFEFLLQ